jgi:hypothetical protein
LTNADCAGTATPVCSARSRCVQCATDDECPAASPFCNQDRCVQCRNDGDCPASSPNCRNRTCAAN